MTTDNSKDNRPVVVVLGAGKPFRGAEPSALQSGPRYRPALEWSMRAFSALKPEIHFVGGYQAEKVRRRFPDLHYSFNPDWDTTNATASLLLAPLDSLSEHYVCYSDIVFEADTIDALRRAAADIVFAIDSTYVDRVGASGPRVGNFEKVAIDGGKVLAIGPAASSQARPALFVGVVRLSAAALQKLHDLRLEPLETYRHWPLSQLVGYLRDGGLSVAAVDIAGRWASFDEPQDVARFVLGTKAETLERLRPLVRKSRILKQYMIGLRQWRSDADAELAAALRELGRERLIVRSSSKVEDGWSKSFAGHFSSVLDVAPETASLRSAVEEVIASYNDDDADHQVLVQPMLKDVRASGVAFTRTLRSGAPYYVINYDLDGGRTDSVTSGAGRGLGMLLVHRAQEGTDIVPEGLAELLPAIRELEELVGHDSLDIEFATDSGGKVYVLQLRPIAVDYRQWQSSDSQIEAVLLDAQNRLEAQARPPLGQAGDAIYGVMPDWNPAEIIGIRPRRLALSLYQHLITNEIWAKQRAECGYRDVRPSPLVIAFAGHPYVDVRASFNSFVPAQLPAALGDRLASHYVDCLKQDSRLHDKVEFEIAVTCSSLSIDRRLEKLRNAGFSAGDIAGIKDALTAITIRGISECRKHRDRANLLEGRQLARERIEDPLERAWALLEDCRLYGTLPFAHLARQGFVAVEMLRSAVEEGVIAADDFTRFMRSLKTVATVFSEDSLALANGALSQADFIARYGHLRPGTYEITLPSYAEDPYSHVAIGAQTHEAADEPFSWSGPARKAWTAALARIGIDVEFDAFDRFLREAIEGREASKFEFTRLLSRALDAIAAFGAHHQIDREQLSHIAWPELAAIRLGVGYSDLRRYLAVRAAEGAEAYRVASAVELPAIIASKQDLWRFAHQEDKANFIGYGRATAPMLDLSGRSDMARLDLAGKIVVIQQADPGYDWLFLRNIAGLITVYGGANSHMAIRAAEFGLPAAIGIGEVVYERIRNAKSILLDCDMKRLSVLQ